MHSSVEYHLFRDRKTKTYVGPSLDGPHMECAWQIDMYYSAFVHGLSINILMEDPTKHEYKKCVVIICGFLFSCLTLE